MKKLVDLAKINKIKKFFLQKFINDKLIRESIISCKLIENSIKRWTLSNTNSITLSLDKYQIYSAVFSGSTLSIDLLSILNLFHNKAFVCTLKAIENLKSNQHTALKSK
ncbi:hypothetical protein BpHYR1_033209 [Brachionus plicatilis]|uniref:Uncharacterized protein n=1 Tax=Brachionus plicatilis TaxID=10195 RepID=A0A3M7S701_BRAPC|nr:hypothetical protein BpHYR1_033209 [Brachionus plicatilis]